MDIKDFFGNEVLNNIDHKKLKDIVDELTNKQHSGIFIQGKSGSGKTKLILDINNRIMSTYIEAYKINKNDDYTDRNVLCLDAVGLEADYYKDTIRRLVMVRRHEGRYTIIGTSLSEMELIRLYGPTWMDCIKNTFKVVSL